MAKYVAAIDQGTTSTRCMIFTKDGKVVSVDQREHQQIFPKPGWVEHDPEAIWQRTQGETAVVWNRKTGKPVYNAIVWQDTRTDQLVNQFAKDGGQDRFRAKVGLPLATYFSGPKIRWILDNVEGARAAAEAGDLAFG